MTKYKITFIFKLNFCIWKQNQQHSFFPFKWEINILGSHCHLNDISEFLGFPFLSVILYQYLSNLFLLRRVSSSDEFMYCATGNFHADLLVT